jgi:hypothetical protein
MSKSVSQKYQNGGDRETTVYGCVSFGAPSQGVGNLIQQKLLKDLFIS